MLGINYMIKENSTLSFFDLVVSEKLNRQECFFYELIKVHPGITRQELSSVSGRPINAVSGRVAGMLKKEFIIERGNDLSFGRSRAKLYAVFTK